MLKCFFTCSRNSRNNPSQIVGIPAAIVTLSLSMNLANLSGVNRGPGITCVVPNHVPANGVSHALT